MPLLSNLPRDVLELIVEQLTAQDALQLSRTNKRLNNIAVFYVLRDVRLSGERDSEVDRESSLLKTPDSEGSRAPNLRRLERVASFASFVLSNPALYAHHIRSLALIWGVFCGCSSNSELTSGNLDRACLCASAPPLLVQVLGHAGELRRLTIYKPGWMRSHTPELLDAIAALDKLDYLEIGQTQWEFPAIISRIRSRPSEIVLDGCSDRGSTLEHLKPHASTLRRLTLRRIKLDNIADVSFSWPHVETLILRYVCASIPFSALPRLFPNARRVTLWRLSGSVLDGSSHWPSVDTFTAASLAPVVSSQIRRVDMMDAPWRHGLQPLEWISPVVLSYTPRLLPGTHIDDLASGTWCTSLRFLRLHGIQSDEEYWEQTLVPHLRRLSASPLCDSLKALSLRQHPFASFAMIALFNPNFWISQAQKLIEYFPNLDYVGFEVATDNAQSALAAAHWYRQFRAKGDDQGPPILVQIPQSEISDLIWMLENMERVSA
ncbi:hypothetical protein K466DRAFT_600365 [Polyporus arcularius HHB13444]|uniref:F-box domain-containing protein n=1 Tax=Polyporus arcularius HHB13444 TaxID=1314778 RepID=A0A5C3PDV5_9APHY|nr:hypothetical protein K466DRAFT_600365 [Polyporus arcularius HHB13444]